MRTQQPGVVRRDAALISVKMKSVACQRLQLLFGLLLSQYQFTCVAAEQRTRIVLHDPSEQLLRSAHQASISPSAATAALCAASGLVPPVAVDLTTAADVEAVLQAQAVLGQAPKALLLLHLAGVSPESSSFNKLEQAWGAGSTVHLDLQDSKHGASAGSLLQAASDIVAANPGTPLTVLDHSILQDCRAGKCLQQHLHRAMHHCGGKLHGQHDDAPAHQHKSKFVLRGTLELPGLDQKLDMQLPGVKLFALELAALQGAVGQQVAQLKQQSAEELDKVTSLYESTFVGLQALGAHFPRGSPELEAAEGALMDMLSSAVSKLKGVYGDDMLYQVTFLGDAPVSSGDASHLMEWKEVSRRVLLQRSVKSDSQPLKADEGASSKRYAEKATAYGVTLLLIWFTFAGIYCMVSMHFKQDTLLYGRSKSD